jgi:hypothetical protein
MSISLFVNNNNSYEQFKKKLNKYCKKNDIPILVYPEDKHKIIEVCRERRRDKDCKYGKMVVLVEKYDMEMWTKETDIRSMYSTLSHVGITLIMNIDTLGHIRENQSYDTGYLIYYIDNSLKIVKYTTHKVYTRLSQIFK